jgi:hypothetical protein
MEQERKRIDGQPVYRVPENNLGNLQARVAKMNRRAAKLGMEPLVVTERGEEFELYYRRDTRWDEIELGRKINWAKVQMLEGESIEAAQARFTKEKGQRHTFSIGRFVLVTVMGSLPRVNGWAMAATIQHAEGGNLLMTVPGFETTLPLKYRTASTLCEHCNMDRQRKDTYVLQHEDGSWKQVGRNCLADFIRSNNAGAWAEAAELLASLDSELGAFEDLGGGFGHATLTFRAEELLAQVACIVRQDGWCSRTEAKNSFDGKQATVDLALCLFDPKYVAKLKERDQERFIPIEDDKAKALKAIEWAQSLPADVSNDYLWNIRVVSHRESLTPREAGLAGSIIAAYLRHLEQEVKRAYEHLNEHFGTVGKREVFTLTVTAERDMESDYGRLTMYKFRDAEGRTAVWFSSASIVIKGADGETRYGLVVGDTYQIKATVKKHDVYQDRKQTVLTRGAVLAPVAKAAA